MNDPDVQNTSKLKYKTIRKVHTDIARFEFVAKFWTHYLAFKQSVTRFFVPTDLNGYFFVFGEARDISALDGCITGSTVVLTCCKGDGQSQWKTPIFGPSQLGNPLTDFDKI